MPQATTHPRVGGLQDPDLTDTRILVVEDDSDVRGLIALALTLQGYRVDTAATAWEGLRLLEMHEYAVVLSDYALPGRDGVWMLTQAESEGWLERTRGVLVVTAHPAPIGAEHMTVVTKPIDFDLLVRRIEALVRPRVTRARRESPSTPGPR